MMLLSIGDKVREGTYKLHSSFRRAINFTDGRRLVTLVTPDIGAGPVNIVVGDLTPFGSSSGLTQTGFPPSQVPSLPLRHRAPSHGNGVDLRVEHHSVVFANRRFLLDETQSYGSLLHIEKETSRPVFRENLKIVENTLAAESHPKSLAFLLDAKRERDFRTAFDRAFVAQVKDGASRMFLAAGVRRLAGCGFGLTPSGDDFIAGMLIGVNVLQQLTGRNNHRLIQTIYSAAAGKNLLSNSFLRLARDGRVSEKMQNLVSTLFDHGDTEVKERTEEVMTAGETSGADLLTGFVMTVKRY